MFSNNLIHQEIFKLIKNYSLFNKRVFHERLEIFSTWPYILLVEINWISDERFIRFIWRSEQNSSIIREWFVKNIQNKSRTIHFIKTELWANNGSFSSTNHTLKFSLENHRTRSKNESFHKNRIFHERLESFRKRFIFQEENRSWTTRDFS